MDECRIGHHLFLVSRFFCQPVCITTPVIMWNDDYDDDDDDDDDADECDESNVYDQT